MQPSSRDSLQAIVEAALDAALTRALASVPDLSRFRLLKVREAAAMLSVDETTARKMLLEGELECVLVRSERRVTLTSIDAYIARQRAATEAATRRGRIKRLI